MPEIPVSAGVCRLFRPLKNLLLKSRFTLEQMKQYFIKHQHAREIGDKKMMEKIEYHLTYINFHYECGLLATGQYDKLPEVIQNW